MEDLGGELRERIILYAVTDLDWVTANFAVFDVALTSNRQVENHRNFFSTVGAGKGVLHQNSMLRQSAWRILPDSFRFLDTNTFTLRFT